MGTDLEGILKESFVLFDTLDKERAKFETFISPEGYEKDQGTFEIAGCTKTLLRNTWQLGGQTIRALQQGSLFLGLIGARTLLEYVFRVRYIFDHPNHPKDKAWATRLAIEFREAQPGLAGLEKLVHKFDNLTPRELASAVGMSEFYEKEYASLCHYTHPGCEALKLNKKETCIPFTAHAAVQCVTFVFDCISYAAMFWQYSITPGLEERIKALGDDADKKLPMPVFPGPSQKSGNS